MYVSLSEYLSATMAAQPNTRRIHLKYEGLELAQRFIRVPSCDLIAYTAPVALLSPRIFGGFGLPFSWGVLPPFSRAKHVVHGSGHQEKIRDVPLCSVLPTTLHYLTMPRW
jgi:hypothetical protein